jgi:hypothetical protein
MTRYEVRRYNRKEVEVVRGLDFRTARRIVERDESTGTVSSMEEESRVRASGRIVR